MNADQRRTERLRDALTTVADRHDLDPDAWDAIAGRTQLGSTPHLAEVGVRPSRRAQGRRTSVLAAAAVVGVIAGVGAATAIAQHDAGDDSTRVDTAAPVDEPTGWYVPVGLPDGWRVLQVTSTRMDDACPCRTAVWANADRSQVVIASRSDAPTMDGQALDVGTEDLAEFDLGQGVTATRTGPMQPTNPVDASDDYLVEWKVDGQQTSFSTLGLEVDDAEPIARALFADPVTDRIPVAGLTLVDQWNEDGEVGKAVDVDVMMQAPSGNPIDYSLQAPRMAVPYAWNYELTDRLAGQPLATLENESGGKRPEGSEFPDMPVTHDYLGRWPGATVRSAGFREGKAGSDEVAPTDAEVETLMASLRPATTEEWRRFVARAGNRDRTVTASATLADLIDGITTPVTDEATTTLPPDQAGELGDLELSLAAEPRLASWEDAGVQLTVRNPTPTAITDRDCVLDRAEVALLPVDAATRSAVQAVPAGDPWWSEDGPCDGGVTIEPGASKTIRLVARAQFHDSRYGPLPGGSYEATVRIDGVDAPVPAPVAIGSTCAESTAGYVGLTETQARTLAAERAIDEVRVPEPGPDSDVADEDCNRLNLVLADDGRVAYARLY